MVVPDSVLIFVYLSFARRGAPTDGALGVTGRCGRFLSALGYRGGIGLVRMRVGKCHDGLGRRPGRQGLGDKVFVVISVASFRSRSASFRISCSAFFARAGLEISVEVSEAAASGST